jgi:hypothetical protein
MKLEICRPCLHSTCSLFPLKICLTCAKEAAEEVLDFLGLDASDPEFEVRMIFLCFVNAIMALPRLHTIFL